MKENKKEIKLKAVKKKNTRTEVESFKNWIRKKVDQVTKEALIDFISMEISFRNKDKHTNKGGNVIFEINYEKPYRQGTIFVYPQAFELYKHKYKKVLIDGLIHEVAHIHTIPFSKIAKERCASYNEIHDAEEELTETMAEYMRRYIKHSNKLIYKI